MPNPKTRDRRVIGNLVGADHPESDILATAPLNRSRGPLSDRIGEEQERDHHRRLVRRAPPPIGAIRAIEVAQIHHPHRVEHEPREMIFSQPLPQAWRQQQLLLTITRQEVLSHKTPPTTPTTASS
jgi:hypothetical protein